METIIRDKIVKYLEENKIIKDSQHGFRTKRSCLTNLLDFFYEVFNSYDETKAVDIIYLDFQKAFDTVPHKRLISKVKAHGIAGNTLKWLRDWLSDRKQRVVINGKESEWHKVNSGVPQGSVLQEFVTALRDVKKAVDDIHREVSATNEVCVDVKSRLQATKSETRHLIHQTTSLQNRSNKLHIQETVAEAFVRCFQLTPDEVATIKGSTRESPITPEFFTILDKTQKIRSNTKYLLQTGHQNTALDVVEQMNVCREAGLERLYRWL
ncbi:conserved oligomeric Golgi complex subunit 6-like isoform X2 [Scylla paramamosain]|uniref:conserved oligomeric Golgi complex subunit 6-like isoform X2 n=1 Tax=Scylla paramamosain TaxID=85552 RepID=UPI0030832BC2